MAIDHIRISSRAKDQLTKIKRHTGIQHWNVVCRWAFCRSLAEPTPPADADIPVDSNVEMTWKTFGGKSAELYLALLKHRCWSDGLELEPASLERQFRLHLHRGIGYLSADRELRSISRLAGYVSKPA